MTTRDALFGGRVALEQPARGEGYRVNVDAILLAAFAAHAGRARVAIDLGAGVGGVALSLLHLGAVARVVLVEIEPAAASLAERNLAANGWTDRGIVVRGDVVDGARAHAGEAQLVVANPPYVEPGHGRAPSIPARARARSGGLARFVAAARVAAGRRARICFVYPARDAVALSATFREHGLEPKRVRFVHASASAPARVVLVEVRAAKPGGLVVEPPLVERVGDAPSAEIAALLAAERAS